MALDHAQPGDAITLSPPADTTAEVPSTALFKSADLEVMRLMLRAGTSLPPHAVAGDITVQCLQGRLDVAFDGRSQVLAPGQLLYLRGGVRHGVAALDDACALVTIALHGAGSA